MLIDNIHGGGMHDRSIFIGGGMTHDRSIFMGGGDCMIDQYSYVVECR